MTKPVVVSRWQWLKDTMTGALVTLVALVVCVAVGVYAGRLRYVPPGDWFVTKNSCAPGRTLSDVEEKAWTEACITLWKIGKEKP